jgi:hypothetical protein
MAKKIKWKESKIDYSKLSELNDQKVIVADYARLQGKENVESGHLKDISPLGGKVVGNNNSENGHIQLIQSQFGGLGGTKAQEEVNLCPNCGRTIKSKIYYRFHGDKCSFNGIDINELYKKWKNGASKKDLMVEYNLKRTSLDSQLDFMKA